MINIVIPMAGLGSRFVKAGYTSPKPFIDVGGIPMIQRVVNNLTPYEPHRFIFIARREHESLIREHMSFATDVVYVDEVTQGAACTVLLAEQLINNKNPLVVANSDQFVEWNDGCKTQAAFSKAGGVRYWRDSNNLQDMINDCRKINLDASIATFNSNHSKWSYVKLNNYGVAVEVAEKKVISEHATVGVYYYAHGDDFVAAAKDMIELNIRVNNEFYVCPVFNQMIVRECRIGIYDVEKMHGMGTPEDLDEFKMEL